MTRVDVAIVTAVWGDWHLHAYLNVNLPTLLAPRNLPSLIERHRVTYEIYTRSADLGRLRNSDGFRRLAMLLPVKVRTVRQRKLSDPIAAHVEIWRKAVGKAA